MLFVIRVSFQILLCISADVLIQICYHRTQLQPATTGSGHIVSRCLKDN